MKRATIQSTHYNQGANDERSAILAYLRRKCKVDDLRFLSAGSIIADIIEWVAERAKRTQAKKGGLGRVKIKPKKRSLK